MIQRSKNAGGFQNSKTSSVFLSLKKKLIVTLFSLNDKNLAAIAFAFFVLAEIIFY